MEDIKTENEQRKKILGENKKKDNGLYASERIKMREINITN